MREWKRTVPFVTDERGVSEVVGAVLLFGILILALTTYQATVVPQQNAQTEFQHFEEVRNELIELRNAVSTAGQADVSQFPSVTLGTNYQTRLFTINPPAPAGTLQTSESYNITISNGTEEYDKNISTRFIEYQPGYHEISIGFMRYEHSVLYLDERERGNDVSIIEDQNIVKDGTVRITAVQNQFRETSTGRVTLELYPQDELNASDFPEPDGEGNLTVSIPTRLNQTDYWDDALSDSGGIYQDVDPYPDADDVYHLNLEVNESDLEVNTVGIRKEPDEGPGKNTNPLDRSNSDDTTDETTTTSGVFEELTVSGRGNLNNVDLTYKIDPSAVDSIEFRLYQQSNNNGSPDNTKTISSPGSGTQTDSAGTGGGNPSTVTVEAITFDSGGNPIETCVGTTTGSDLSKTDGDFTCTT